MSHKTRKIAALAAGFALTASASMAMAPMAQAQSSSLGSLGTGSLGTGSQGGEAVAPDAYLEDEEFTELPGTAEGNLSNPFSCQANWVTQSVFTQQMWDFSVPEDTNNRIGNPDLEGFLQSVNGGFGPSGRMDIQHWAAGENVMWRIPIAVNQDMGNAKMVIDYSDTDYDAQWAANLTEADIEQQSGVDGNGKTWADRFWGTDEWEPLNEDLDVQVDAANKTITVDLSKMKAGTATIIRFAAKPADGKRANDRNNDTVYGLQATVQGTTDCDPTADIPKLLNLDPATLGTNSLGTNSLGANNGQGSGSLGTDSLGSAVAGGLTIGSLIWAGNNNMIALPPEIAAMLPAQQ